MKNKILLIILIIILIGCCLVGCDGARARKEKSCGITPKITEYGTNYYHYIVDENTEVVYLAYCSGSFYGMTVMLNADGTPITAEQLNLR